MHPLRQEVASTFDKLEVEILSDDEGMDDDVCSESGNDNVNANLTTKKGGSKDQVRACRNLANQLISLVEVGAASGSTAGCRSR